MIVVGFVVAFTVFMFLSPLDALLSIRDNPIASMAVLMFMCMGLLLSFAGLAFLFDSDSAKPIVGYLAQFLMLVVTGVLLFCAVNIVIGEGDLIAKVMRILIDTVSI
jgi:hypothetical protein